MVDKIRIIVFEPGKRGEVREIDNDLFSMQAIVGGYLQLARKDFFLPYLLPLLFDEDGISKDLPPNRWNLLGTLFVVRSVGSEFVSLTDDDVTAVTEYAKETD